MRSDLIRKNINIAKFTTMEVGGTVEFYSKPRNLEELKYLMNWALDRDVKTFLLGSGSDVIFGDGHHHVLIIDLKYFKEISIHNRYVKAMAGVNLNKLIKMTAESGLSGMEELFGIPGTVGGSVKKNAGAFGREIKDILESARIFTSNGEMNELGADKLGLTYRESNFDGILIEATFKLTPENPDRIKDKMREIIGRRKATQPRGKTSGCIFKNPENGPPAGYLLDRSGLKGFKIGGAKYSEVHANFIVNIDGAKTSHVFELINEGKKRVYENFGIMLEEEVVILR